MNTNRESTSNKEIRYLRFLNETLKAKELRDGCDTFTRKIFEYLEGEPHFDSQVFCALLYNFIFRCKLFRGLVIQAQAGGYGEARMSPAYAKISIDGGSISNDIFSFLNQNPYRFALSSVDPNQFTTSLEDKLKHLLDTETPTWKASSVKIILPEANRNTDIVPYVDLEFTLPCLSVMQKLDVIHFAICGLNFLSQKDQTMKVISENLVSVRDSVIYNSIRDKDNLEDDLDFDESLPDISRILTAQEIDTKIEKQWQDENSPVFIKSETETLETNLDEKLKITLTARQWLIALRFFINHYNLREIDVSAFARLLAVMNNGKNLQNFRRDLGNERGLITAKTREDAKEVANLCRDVGLTKIADEIESAITRIKLNNL